MAGRRTLQQPGAGGWRRAVLPVATLTALVLACASAGTPGPRPETRPTAARARPAAWNQARVAAYAGELAEAVERLKMAVAGEPPLPEASLSIPQRRAHEEFRSVVRLLSHASADLAAELDRGGSREQTAPLFARVQELRRDLEHLSQKTLIGQPVLVEVLRAGDALLRLIPYYEYE